MRDLSQPEILDRRTREDWQERGSKDLYSEAVGRARDIVAEHRPNRCPTTWRRGSAPSSRRPTAPPARSEEGGDDGRPNHSFSPEGGALGQERKKLKKVLFRFDLVFFTIAAFVSLDTIAVTAAYGGGQTFFWLAFLIVVYLIPTA